MAEKTRELLPRQELLLEQYRLAMHLYCHEDQLNWRKLNNLLYINIALGAVVGYLMRVEPYFTVLTPETLQLLSCVIGLFVCVGFAFAIRTGTNYLVVRKNTVLRIEKILMDEYGGTHVASHPEAGHHVERRSPTTVVLLAAPFFFGLIWLGLLIAGLF